MFFLQSDVTLSAKLLELLYIFCGLICLYAGFKNLNDDQNPNRFGTFVFWAALGLALALAKFVPAVVEGVIVVVCIIPTLLKRVKPGYSNSPTKEEMEKNFEKIGLKLFVPALSIGVFALLFGLSLKFDVWVGAVLGVLAGAVVILLNNENKNKVRFAVTFVFIVLGFSAVFYFAKKFAISALVGTGFGVLVAIVLLMVWNKENKPKVFLNDSERFLSIVGPLSLLPTLLSILGAVFTKAGVGGVIASLVGAVIPSGNLAIGIVVFAVGMMLFTMIMGNAFAAITVMTVGIGVPFVLSLGANPAVVGILALSCGYCGTLLTPMAANFNIVPVAILEMKDRMGVIKSQVFIAFLMLIAQILLMIFLA